MNVQNSFMLNLSRNEEQMTQVVVMAASAGGLQALSVVLTGLPADFPVPLVVVQHLDPHHPSLMAHLLGHRTHLRVKQAEHGEPLNPGVVYIAVPNHHLLINANHTLSLSSAETVRFLRPSANLLFVSAAAAYKQGVIAVVLSGTGSDGSTGIQAIKEAGGKVIVQDIQSSAFPGMPASAIETGCADFIVPLQDIAQTLIHLVKRSDENTP